MQDAAATMTVSDPGNYAAYLEVQGDNPLYSSGNILLAMTQNSAITQIGTAERWRSLGRTVKEHERTRGVQIYTKGNFSKGYTIGSAYDISQTTGREVPPTKQITEGSRDMEKALEAVMNYSLVPISADDSLPEPALYDSHSLELYVNTNFSETEIFAGLASEVAHSRIHNKGKNVYYTRKDNDLDAKSVAYLLCKRFGVKCDMPDLSGLTAQYEGWTAPQIKQALGYIQEMSKQIGGSIEKSITPQNQNRGSMRRPAR